MFVVAQEVIYTSSIKIIIVARGFYIKWEMGA